MLKTLLPVHQAINTAFSRLLLCML